MLNFLDKKTILTNVITFVLMLLILIGFIFYKNSSINTLSEKLAVAEDEIKQAKHEATMAKVEYLKLKNEHEEVIGICSGSFDFVMNYSKK